MIEGPMPSVGSVIDWGSRVSTIVARAPLEVACFFISTPQEMGWYQDPCETEAMATSVEDTHGVYFVPAFSGLAVPYQGNALTLGGIVVFHT